MSTNPLTFTGEDLRDIADLLDRVERTPSGLFDSPILHRVEVTCAGSFEVTGYLIPNNGGWAFTPARGER